MNPVAPRTRVHVTCKDITEGAGPGTMSEVIEVCTFGKRLVNEMGTWEFNRTTIEDIEDAIVAAGFRSGVRTARVTVQRVVEGGIGRTVLTAKLGYV